MNKLLLALALTTAATAAQAACSYKEDAFGNLNYNCNGQSGKITTDSFGTSRDSLTGETWRTDAFGNTRSSSGTTFRTDAFGNTRSSDGTVWRTDAFGNTRSSNGTVCRTDSFNRTTCQ